MNAQIDHHSRFIVGLDVGGTKVEVAIADLQGEIVTQIVRPMVSNDSGLVVKSIATAIDAALQQARFRPDQLVAGQAGVPGQIENGLVKYAVNLNLNNFPLAEALSELYGIPFSLENDVRTAAMGAFSFYSHKSSINNLAYLSIGTGIAAGIILDGCIYRGANGAAGEIGHTIFDLDGPECRCGMHGCLEALAAGPAMAAQAQEAIRNGEETTLRQVETVDSSSIYAAHRENDPVAARIVHTTSRYLAQAVEWLVMAYDVDLLVLGGGVTHEGDGFLLPLWQELECIRDGSEFARRMLTESKIVLFPTGLNAGVLGSIALAKSLLQKPGLASGERRR